MDLLFVDDIYDNVCEEVNIEQEKDKNAKINEDHHSQAKEVNIFKWD